MSKRDNERELALLERQMVWRNAEPLTEAEKIRRSAARTATYFRKLTLADIDNTPEWEVDIKRESPGDLSTGPRYDLHCWLALAAIGLGCLACAAWQAWKGGGL